MEQSNPLWHLVDAAFAACLIVVASFEVKYAVIAWLAAEVVGKLLKAFVEFLRPIAEAVQRAKR